MALWHERDISHSSAERVVLPDASIALDYILHKATSLIAGLVVHPERMLANLQLTRGLVFSGQLLLALTQKGVSRESAYEWVQRNAMKVWDQNENFQELFATGSRHQVTSLCRRDCRSLRIRQLPAKCRHDLFQSVWLRVE